MGEVRRHERGAAAVEFALVVPLLLVLLFGVISYGMMLSFRQSLSQAAAEGARAAAVAPRAPSDPGYGAAAQAATAIGEALGGDFSCAGGQLMKGETRVGACTISATAGCAAAASPATGPTASSPPCVYTVTLSYEYRSHPAVANPPLVPIPRTITYVSSAQGNA